MANDRLRAAMAAAGLTIGGLAERIDVDPKTVERWITTGRVPRIPLRFQAAQLLGRDVAYLWPESVDDAQSERANEAELVRFYSTRAAIPRGLWRSLLQHATEHVEFLVYAGQFLIDAHPELGGLLAAKASTGTRVRLLMGDPESDAVRRRGDEEGIGADLSARIRLTLAGLRSAIEAPQVEVRLHNTTLYCSTYRFDNDIFVNTHVFGAPAALAPVLHLRRLPGGRLFDQYVESFNRVWACGQPVDATGSVARMGA